MELYNDVSFDLFYTDDSAASHCCICPKYIRHFSP